MTTRVNDSSADHDDNSYHNDRGNTMTHVTDHTDGEDTDTANARSHHTGFTIHL